MANVTLWGASYTDVPAVTLPQTGGGVAAFHDVTDTTAVAADVATGKYFHAADGTLTEGTSSGGGDYTAQDFADLSKPSGSVTFTKNIGQQSLLRRTGMTDVSISSGATSIGDESFRYSAISSVNVGASVTSIGGRVFQDCTSLTSITIDGNPTIGSYLAPGCSNLTSFSAPNYTGKLAWQMFQDDHLLTSVNVPKATSTEAYAFRNCTGLTTVVFPKVTSIAGATFANSGLTTLVLGSTSCVTIQNTGAFDQTVFAQGGTGGTVYIPESLYEHLGDGSNLDYKHATNWATIDGYGTITWAKIEGSIYE